MRTLQGCACCACLPVEVRKGRLTEGATAAGCANKVDGGVGSSFGWNVTDSLNEFCITFYQISAMQHSRNLYRW
jgi:hypothetical protein